MSKETRAKLTFGDHFMNVSIACHSLIVGPWNMFRFLLRINRHRGPRVGRGFRWPRVIRVDTLATGVPGGLLAEWEQYGILACLLPGGFVRVAGSRKERVCSFWVSPNQHWMADRHARARGWVVFSGPVQDRTRGSSAVDAEKGAWRASGAEPAGASFIRMAGNLLGVRQTYVNTVRNLPGLRKPR